MITLFTHFNAVCGQKVHLLLDLLQIEYSLHPVNLRGGEQHSPWFKTLNPHAQVPVLQDGNAIICESNDICVYLDKKYNHSQLHPQSVQDKELMIDWLKFINDVIHPACSIISWSIAIRPEMAKLSEQQLDAHFASVPDEDRRKRQVKAMKFGLKLPELEAALAVHKGLINKIGRALVNKEYLMGQQLSIADIVTLPYIERLSVLSLNHMWSDITQVEQWYQRMKQLPSYQECFHNYYPPGFIQRWQDYGKKAALSLTVNE